MPYVSRDDSGNINGLYANPQPGYAEEFLPDDDPEVVAFINPPRPIDPALDGVGTGKTAAQILGAT
jgi:hypothetical protein